MIQYRTNADKVAKELQGIARDFPREFRQAFATLSRGLKTRIGEVVRTGRSAKLGVSLPFAPLDPLTTALSKRKTFGGRMSKSITSYVDTNGLRVQFPYGLRKYGTKFQTSEARPIADNERAFLEIWARDSGFSASDIRGARKGAKSISGADALFLIKAQKSQLVYGALSKGYNRPARPIFAPIVEARGFRRYCLDVVRKRIASIIEKRAKRR